MNTRKALRLLLPDYDQRKINKYAIYVQHPDDPKWLRYMLHDGNDHFGTSSNCYMDPLLNFEEGTVLVWIEVIELSYGTYRRTEYKWILDINKPVKNDRDKLEHDVAVYFKEKLSS